MKIRLVGILVDRSNHVTLKFVNPVDQYTATSRYFPRPPPLLLCQRLLLVALTEPGQGCLIPVPYFAGFDYTLAMAGVTAWPVVGTSNVEGGVDAVISPRALQRGLRWVQTTVAVALIIFVSSGR